MIIVTSIYKNHSNAQMQHEAIESWRKFGKCYSLNCKEEADQLKLDHYWGVEFIETDKTIQHFVKKPLVNINAIIDFAKQQDSDLMVVNSDIVLRSLPDLHQDGITIFSRYDYTDNYADAEIFPFGFDAFFIPKKFLSIFPPSIFALGACWHDYYYPIHCMMNDIPVYYPTGKHAFHKLHQAQYPFSDYEYLGEFFRWHFRFDKHLSIPQVNTSALGLIRQKIHRY